MPIKPCEPWMLLETPLPQSQPTSLPRASRSRCPRRNWLADTHACKAPELTGLTIRVGRLSKSNVIAINNTSTLAPGSRRRPSTPRITGTPESNKRARNKIAHESRPYVTQREAQPRGRCRHKSITDQDSASPHPDWHVCDRGHIVTHRPN